MLGSFLYCSLIDSFQDDVVVVVVVVTSGFVSVVGSVLTGSLDVSVSYTGTVSCVICSLDIVIFLFHFPFAALI